MAVGKKKSGGQSTLIGARWIKSAVAVSVVLSVVASSCGQPVEQTKGELEHHAAVEADDSVTESYVDPEPANSDVNDEPVAMRPAEPVVRTVEGNDTRGAATTQWLTPLPVSDSTDELTTLLGEIHGPADDISVEVSKLLPFPQIPTPSGAHIMSVEGQTQTEQNRDENHTTVSTRARAKVDGTPQEVLQLFDSALTEDGWILRQRDEYDREPASTRLTFYKSGRWDDSESLAVTVGHEPDLDITEVAVHYQTESFPDPDRLLSARFAGWHPELPLPDGGYLERAWVASQFGPGRTTVYMGSSFTFNSPFEEKIRDWKKIYEAEAEAKGITMAEDGVTISKPGNGFDQIRLRGHRSNVVVSGTVKAPTPPFRDMPIVGDEKSTELLPAGATVDQIRETVNDILGPTADVSAQVQRIGVFPEIAHPGAGDIVGLATEIDGAALHGAVKKDLTTEVTMYVDGSVDEIIEFYRAELADLGAEQGAVETEEEDEFATTTTVMYELPENEGGPSSIELTIFDYIDEARPLVHLRYLTRLPIEESGLERWTALYGNAPMPDGGQVYGADFRMRRRGSLSLGVTVRYPNTLLSDLVPAVEEALLASDYMLEAGETLTRSETADLSHREYSSAHLYVASAGSSDSQISLWTYQRMKEN